MLMSIFKHNFTKKIIAILDQYSNGQGDIVLKNCEIIQYLNIKTKSANKGSKSRANYANLYAFYVLVEDYLNGSFDKNGGYSDYNGANFSSLLRRQRELPFGNKLQNHALNHRMNEEFKKYFPECEHLPIIRDVSTNKYWANENLIIAKINGKEINLAAAIIDIINSYIEEKQRAFSEFMDYCKKIIVKQKESPEQMIQFIKGLFRPNIDARIFEIASFAVLKWYYAEQEIYWGWSLEDITNESLTLYKTGRTNANDGGIDFVMKPLGRFFQVTETVDAGKYFLDIDKVQKYPITFVVKTNETHEEIKEKIKCQAEAKYKVNIIVEKYMGAIEEIINLSDLSRMLEKSIKAGQGANIIEEIVIQSQIEFNIESE